MIKYFEDFVNENVKKENNWSMKTVDYSVLVKDYNSKPVIYADSYKIIKIEDDTVECKLKGIKLVNLSDYEEFGFENKKMGWIEFNDNETEDITKISKKCFNDGTIKKKTYKQKKED